MSEFKFHCIHCGQRILADANSSGSVVPCPACGMGITVPPIAQSGSVGGSAGETENVALPPPLPKRLPIAPQNLAPASSRKRISPLHITGIILLIATVAVAIFPLLWTKFSDDQLAGLISVLLRLLMGAGVMTWVVFWNAKLKRFAFIGFSTFCLLSAVYFAWVVEKAKKGTTRADATIKQAYRNAAEAIQEVSDGKVLNVKPSGDATMDAAFAIMNSFARDYADAEKRIESQGGWREEQDISSQMMANKDMIRTELSKRHVNRSILQSCDEQWQSLMEAAKRKIAGLQLSAKLEAAAMRGLERPTVIHNKAVAGARRKQDAEIAFLEFLQAHFDDYHFNGDKLVITNASTSKQYAELARSVEAARNEEAAAAEEQSRAIEAAKEDAQSRAR